MLPRKLGDVNQAADPTEVNEEATEVNDGVTTTRWVNLTLLEGVQVRTQTGSAQAMRGGQNNVVTVLVQLNDLG